VWVKLPVVVVAVGVGLAGLRAPVVKRVGPVALVVLGTQLIVGVPQLILELVVVVVGPVTVGDPRELTTTEGPEVTPDTVLGPVVVTAVVSLVTVPLVVTTVSVEVEVEVATSVYPVVVSTSLGWLEVVTLVTVWVSVPV
jgi:hypothetical protein